MRRLSIIFIIPLLLAGLLSACQAHLTVAQQRATAVSGGCWPYGYDQPAPTRTPYVRYGTATPSPTPPPTGIAYPTCTPAPLTPTVTPKPTVTLTPRPPRTPVPASVVGGPIEIGNQAGSAWFRTLAIHPVRHTVAIAWIANGSTFDDSKDGQVWVKVQRADRTWNPLQTVNTGFIGKAGYAGLAMTIGYDGTVYVVYGVGLSDNRQVQIVESHDDGLTWSLPASLDGVDADAAPPEEFPGGAPTATVTPGPTPTADPATTATPDPADDGASNVSGESQSGAVIALTADPNGGLHLLYRLRSIAGRQIGYAYRAPGETFWRVTTPAGGNISVEAAPTAEGGLRIAIRDTGPGIAREHLSRVTERFYRVDKSRSRETGGTGLGLAIVKHIAQRHGATLDIQSEVGHGSCFALIFPAQRTDKTAPATISAA